MYTKKIINHIAKNRLVKFAQAIEISCFLISGFLVNHDFFAGGLMLIIGIVAAMIASESAIQEHKIKEEIKKSGSE